MVYGNHTMTHKGVSDLDNAREEILGMHEDHPRDPAGQRNPPRLLRATRGRGGNWHITDEELAQLLKEDHLISRPPFQGHGAMYHLKTLPEMTALADKAIANKGMEYLIIHGVERLNASYQDMWAMKQEELFFPLLDYLKQKSDAGELWVTDHISQHKYETERGSARVQTVSTTPAAIRLKLTSARRSRALRPASHLLTQVPADWKNAAIRQGEVHTTVAVKDGLAKYEALPGGPEIELTRAD